MPLTKNVKIKAQYQQWNAGVDMSQGDILDVFSSLGNRPANSVTIQSTGGSSTLRFNVSEEIHKEPCSTYESWVGLGQGGNRPLPLMVAEVEIARPDLTIDANSIMSWGQSEISIKDIKIVTMASGLRIIVA
jgi:hypothetical protein